MTKSADSKCRYFGCVAKTSGSLVEVAKILTVARPTYLVHEPRFPPLSGVIYNPISSSCVSGGTCVIRSRYRHLEEMMMERGLTVDHTTVYRWVQAYAPELDKRCRPHLRPTNDSMRVDETYIEVKGEWKYLYRAVDSEGNTLVQAGGS